MEEKWPPAKVQVRFGSSVWTLLTHSFWIRHSLSHFNLSLCQKPIKSQAGGVVLLSHSSHQLLLCFQQKLVFFWWRSDHKTICFNSETSGLRCLTSLGVYVGSQDVSTRNVLQRKTFGNARRYGSFPRSGRSHNNHTKDLVKRHHCTILLWGLLMPGCLFKVRRRKSLLDAQRPGSGSTFLSKRYATFHYVGVASAASRHSASPHLTSFRAAETQRGRGGAEEEEEEEWMQRCQSKQGWVGCIQS